MKCLVFPFPILCEGGNEKIYPKHFTILVRYWSNVNIHPMTRYLAMPICNIATAVNLFGALKPVMEDCKLRWKNVVGYASDTANIMVGGRNSFLKYIQERQLNYFFFFIWPTCVVLQHQRLPFSVDNSLIYIFTILSTVQSDGRNFR